MAIGSELALRLDSTVDANLPLGDIGPKPNLKGNYRRRASLKDCQYCTKRLALPQRTP